jgi:hypothetical protein
MKTLKLGLSAAAVAALAILLISEHRATQKLRDDHQALQQQLAQVGDLSREHQRLSNLVAHASGPAPLPEDQLRERLKLRGEVGLLRKQKGELERAQAEDRQSRSGSNSQDARLSSKDYLPRASWTNAGYADPESGLRSFLGAAKSRDPKAILDSMSPAKRAGWASKSDEQIAALGAGISWVSAFRILNREAVSDDKVLLSVFLEGRGGDYGPDGTPKPSFRIQMKPFGTEWKCNDELAPD